MSGKVYLVGAGPGDPELLTLKGARCLAQAEVVVYDFLANPELLRMAPPEAEHIYVGKKGGDHTMGQEDINELLCDLALKGKQVVRLKGGDPYVFGRGGEEVSALASRGLAFEVVPGITSAVAAPSYAGIPVTDRRCSTEVAFVTGHEDPTKKDSTINWQALAGMGTLVFLMGVKNLPEICGRLMEHGKAPTTPAAAVRWGTTSQQFTITGTLENLPDKVREAGMKPPAVTVVGDVVGLRDELLWYEKLPLFGKKVLVTRARGQASRLSRTLASLGAGVVEIPTIAIRPPEDEEPLLRAASSVGSYDWVVFTSPNGVAAFGRALDRVGLDARSLNGVRLAAIGPATADSLKTLGLKADVMAKSFVAEGLLETLSDKGLAGSRMLLPRAAQAREILPETLRSWGALVDVVPAYRTVEPEGAGERLAKALAGEVDVVTFTASSTVANLMKMIDEKTAAEFREKTRKDIIKVAAIGPITADTARQHGLMVHVTPESFTIDALVQALLTL